MKEQNEIKAIKKWKTTGGKINSKRKVGRPKKNEEEKMTKIVSFRLNSETYDSLEEFSSPNTPHDGARQIVEDKLIK